VTGIANGTATITVTTTDGGHTAAASVTVTTDPYQLGGSIQGVLLDSLTTSSLLAGEPVNMGGGHDVVVDGSDLLVVSSDNTVYRIDSATGEVSIFAGSYSGGYRDGVGTHAQFAFWANGGITSDGTSMYIADTGSHCIRKIAADGTVTTLAGDAGTSGDSDGAGADARFNAPSDLVVVGDYLYVADTGNNRIRRVDVSTGLTDTFAGQSTAGTGDGTGTGCEMNAPAAITTDGTNLFVSDTGNNKIRQIVVLTAVVTSPAGDINGNSDYTNDTPGTEADFNQPRGITMVGTDLYVADTGNNVIRKIDTADSFATTTLAGADPLDPGFGFTDGASEAARFYGPRGVHSDGTDLYVTDAGNRAIRKVALSDGTTSTVRQSSQDTSPFMAPHGVTTDGTHLYVADSWSAVIRKVTIADGTETVLAGQEGTTGSVDGPGTSARFEYPFGITTDGTFLYVSDLEGYTVRRVDPADGTTTTIAGTAGVRGTTDAVGAAARFLTPAGITTDGTYLYVADLDGHTIRRITIDDYTVTTIVGASGNSGTSDGAGSAARFAQPMGITTDGSSLFVSEWASHTIRKIDIATNAVTTLAGNAGTIGSGDGIGAAAGFADPTFLTCDGTNLFVVDYANHAIRKIVIATGEVTTLITGGSENGYVNGSLATTKLMAPLGITNTADALYITEVGNSAIRRIR
jgi:sugar lactone lactonase YvrE